MGRWAQARKRGSTPEPVDQAPELPQIAADDWQVDPAEDVDSIIVQLFGEGVTELFDTRFRTVGVGDWTENLAENSPGPIELDTGEAAPTLLEVQVRWRGPADEVGPWSDSKNVLTP